jgi:hypothetical protein
VIRQRLAPDLVPVSENGKPRPREMVVTTADAEIGQLFWKAMLDLEPDAAEGAVISTAALRRSMPPEYQHRDVFDRALLQLALEDKIDIYRDDDPTVLPGEDRSQMLRDDNLNVYVFVAQRRPVSAANEFQS